MRTLLLSAALLGFASICSAEPSPSVQYLMNEPVTLFDWGIIRLYDYVDEYATHYLKTKTVQDIYGTVRYDLFRNKIVISFVITRNPDSKHASPDSAQTSSKNICRSIIQEMRREFFADRNDEVRRSSGIYRFFAHVGARGYKEPLGCYEEIEKMTVIQVSVYSHKDPGRLILHAESPLMGNEISFSGKR